MSLRDGAADGWLQAGSKMGGDLNMKKGWHTQTRENMEKA